MADRNQKTEEEMPEKKGAKTRHSAQVPASMTHPDTQKFALLIPHATLKPMKLTIKINCHRIQHCIFCGNKFLSIGFTHEANS